MGLYPTIGLLIAEIILFGFCYWRDRQPVNPMKPRLVSYRLIMMLLIVFFLATLAHIVAIKSGVAVLPRRKMGM